MARKIYADITIRVVIRADEDADVSEVINELEYNFFDTTGKAQVEDTSMKDFEVVDSK